MADPSPNLLEEFEKTADLVPVPPILRFLNCFVDVAIVYAVSATLFIIVQTNFFPGDEWGNYLAPGGDFWPVILTTAFMCMSFIYYTLFEYANKGRTPGKIATGTIAVREDGHFLTLKDALLRSLCRFIPFEFISAFGYRCWHDSLSKTLVIRYSIHFRSK